MGVLISDLNTVLHSGDRLLKTRPKLAGLHHGPGKRIGQINALAFATRPEHDFERNLLTVGYLHHAEHQVDLKFHVTRKQSPDDRRFLGVLIESA
jgi:hypothetical protein